MTTTYHASGPIRGACPHNHRSIATAYRCAAADHRASRASGCYSDRSVSRVDGEPMTDGEIAELQGVIDEVWS
jgi:hypothetical protein